MRDEYEAWLRDQQYDASTITAQLHRAGRVEKCYGDLDKHFHENGLQSIIDNLTYTADDERRAAPNSSKIPLTADANIRNNLSSYKSAVVRYRKFLAGWERSDSSPSAPSDSLTNEMALVAPVEEPQKLSLERDMQAALRRNIAQLGPTLAVVDDGAERAVASGLIDITCMDSNDDSLVVVELKAGKSDARAIGQILGYMGDLAEEEDERSIKGILVAHEFDKRTRAAARVVPSLRLVRYSVNFTFLEET